MAKSFQFKLVVKGIVFTVILATLLGLGFGLLLYLTSIPESEIGFNMIFNISVLISALLVAHEAGTKGIYYGLAVSIGAIVFSLLFYAIFFPDSPPWLKVGEKTIFAILAGGVGGITGVLFRRA